MMPTALGHSVSAAYPPYTSDAMLDDLSRQMSGSQAARKLSRGSNGQRAGNAMRVVKPTSANNSPRSSMAMAMGRRRTFVNDGNLARRRQQVMEQVVLPRPGTDFPVDPTRRTPRPVSWHPASSQSQIQQPQTQTRTQQSIGHFHLPSHGFLNDHDMFANYHQMSPMPTSHSCQTSPSTFSPLTLPLDDDFGTPSGMEPGSWSLLPQQTPSYVSPALENSMGYPESFPQLPSGSTDRSRTSGTADWNSFLLNGFDKTSPPTPENLPQVQEPKTAMSEEAIPYQSLEESEAEGEVLVGMGLYDTPDKYDVDVGLNNYRSTLSSLLGGNRGHESPGKGLKLEETWQPPESEDEDDDEDEAEDEDDDDSQESS